MSMDLIVNTPARKEVSLIDLLGSLSAFFSYSQDEEEEFKVKLNLEYDQEQNNFVCVPEVLVFVSEEHTELYDHTLNDSYLRLTSSELVDVYDAAFEFFPNFVLVDQDGNTSFTDVNREILKLYISQVKASKNPLSIGMDFTFVCGDLTNELEIWVGQRVNDVYYVINETKIYEPFVVDAETHADSTINSLIGDES